MKLTRHAGLTSGDCAAPGLTDARRDGAFHRRLMRHAG
jgi:hypothetical protein